MTAIAQPKQDKKKTTEASKETFRMTKLIANMLGKKVSMPLTKEIGLGLRASSSGVTLAKPA